MKRWTNMTKAKLQVFLICDLQMNHPLLWSWRDFPHQSLPIDESNANKASEPSFLIQLPAGEAQGASRFALMRVFLMDPDPLPSNCQSTQEARDCNSLPQNNPVVEKITILVVRLYIFKHFWCLHYVEIKAKRKENRTISCLIVWFYWAEMTNSFLV